MLSKAAIRELQRYHRKKHRQADRRLLVEGWRSLEAVVERGIRLEWLLVAENDEGQTPPGDLIGRLTAVAGRTDHIADVQMKAICRSVTPQGLAALIAWEPMAPDELADFVTTADPVVDGPRILIVADGVADPGNLGTIIRTADWFGACGVFAGPGSVELTNPKLVQATMGSLFNLPVGSGPSTGACLRTLKSTGWSVVSLELEGETDVRDLRLPDQTVLVVGNEAHGVSDETGQYADHRVFLPRFGRAESLNAAISVAAVLGRSRLGLTGP